MKRTYSLFLIGFLHCNSLVFICKAQMSLGGLCPSSLLDKFLLKKLISGPMQKAVRIVPIPTKEVTAAIEPPLRRSRAMPNRIQMISVVILT